MASPLTLSVSWSFARVCSALLPASTHSRLTGNNLRHHLGGKVLASLTKEASQAPESATPLRILLCLSSLTERDSQALNNVLRRGPLAHGLASSWGHRPDEPPPYVAHRLLQINEGSIHVRKGARYFLGIETCPASNVDHLRHVMIFK